MSYCSKCGNKLDFNAKFCSNCGKSVKATKNLQTEFILESKRCPNCGNELKAMEAICSACGMEISKRNVSDSIKKFAEELNKIENEKSFSLNPLHGIISKGEKDKKFEKKITLIKSFPIPNTVEEITEFLLLADANIDVKFGKNSLSNKLYGKPGCTYYKEITLANAWISKMQQAYKKAEITFSADSTFEKVKLIYINKMNELKIKV